MNLQELEKQTRAIVIDIVVLKRGFRWFDWEK